MIKRAVYAFSALAALSGMLSVWSTPKAYALSGSDWQAGNVIDDSVFTNVNSMSVQQIQAFIDGQINAGGGCDTWGTKSATDWGRSDLTHAQFATQIKGWSGPPYVCLNEYYEVPKITPASGIPDNSYNHYDVNAKTLQTVPGGLSAAQIIYNAAQQYQISPKVLLVKIQTESAGPLTQDTWPLSQQYTYALGSNCPDSGPGGSAQCDTNYSGFSMQVYSAASLLRSYLDNMQQPWWTHAVPYATNRILWNTTASNCGGGNVYISTKATAALYTYTPYQPNAAALSKLSDSTSGGTGDSCSAYGNRNFWWWYAHWFGNPSYPPSPIDLPNGTYNLAGSGSGKYLDVAGGLSADGTKVDIYDNNGTDAQKWTLTRDNEGYYTIQNVASGKYLDVIAAGTMPGTKLQVWTGNGSCAQKWAIQEVGTAYTFLNACSGLALDVNGNATANGTQLQIYNKNSSPAQLWTLRSLDLPVTANGFYGIHTSAGTVLDIVGGTTTSGTPLQIYNNNGSGAQIWQFLRQDSGLYELRNPQSGKYLNVATASAGSRAQIWDGNHTCAQQWVITANGDGSYSLASSCSGMALDVAGDAVTTDGAAVQIWDSNGSDAQKWTFAKLADNTIPDGLYSLRTGAGTTVDIPGGSTVSGVLLQIFSSNGSGAQVWQLLRQNNGYYELRNPQSGKYLDIPGGSTSPGARLQIWDGNHTCAQQWVITANGDGSYSLASSCSGLSLDVLAGLISRSGDPVQIWGSNGSPAQKWMLAPSS